MLTRPSLLSMLPTDLIYILCVFECLPECMSIHHMQAVAMEVRRGHQTPHPPGLVPQSIVSCSVGVEN